MEKATSVPGNRKARVRAVVVVHNHRNEIASLLSDLAEAAAAAAGADGPGPPFRLVPVLVDEASTDGSSDAARKAVAALGGKVVRSDENRGFAHGVNLAAKTTIDGADEGETAMLILNPDLRLPAPAPRRLYAGLLADGRLAAVGPRFTDGAGSPLPAWYHPPKTATAVLEAAGLLDALAAFRRRKDEAEGGELTLVPEGGSLVGAAMMIARSAWRAVGPFDEAFFLYHEETDWCLRAAEKGYRLAVRNDCVVPHAGGDSIAKLDAAHLATYFRGRVRLEEKHRGAKAARRLARILRAALRFRAALGPDAAKARAALRAWEA